MTSATAREDMRHKPNAAAMPIEIHHYLSPPCIENPLSAPRKPRCISLSATPSCPLPLRDLALRQAHLHILRDVRRNQTAEALNIRTIKRIRKAERSSHNAPIQPKKVLRDLAGARILVIQTRHKRRRLTAIVELVVDAANREDGALEFGDVASDLGAIARSHKPVLDDEAEVEGAIDDGKELGRAWMRVRGVDAAGVEEAHCG